MLLIGSVGSGKSTFTTYLKEVALDKVLVDKLSWITMDLNNAPVSKNEIYNWIKREIISQIKKINNDIDFDTLESIQNLYQDQILQLKKGILQLLQPNSDKYQEILVERILVFQSDIDLTLQSYISQYVHNKSKNLIIVLDNCDKRNLEEQLLMFEVANWIKNTIRAIVILPLRDTTFDLFRKEKPLDTVVKDLTFRIMPPSLEKVLYTRLRYADRLSKQKGSKYYYLPSGVKVSYPAEDELYYLKSILTSLFQNNFFKKLISGLAGSNIRIGLEIFLDFCQSGHISDSEIFKIKQSKGQSSLPNHIVSKVFLRGKRVYYSDSESIIKNLFSSIPSDDIPNPFTRISILKWLHDKYRIKGPSGILGFHAVETMYNNLTALGHDRKRLEDEVIGLLRYSLIISETQKTDKIDIGELISINSTGIVHLEIITNIDYLGACSEDMWYNVVELANKIAKNMSNQGDYKHLSIQSTVENAKLMVDYLENYYKTRTSIYINHITDELIFTPLDFEDIQDKIKNLHKSTNSNDNSIREEFIKGKVYKAKIVSVQIYGLIVEIDTFEKVGLVHISKIKDKDFEDKYKIGEDINVKILRLSLEHNKYDLEMIK